jgi:hypothetical protein
MKNNKTITWILVIALAGIWGTVLYQIYDTVTSGNQDENGRVPVSVSTADTSGDRFIFSETVRDPFHYSVRVDSSRHKPVRPKEPVWLPPPLKLSGILVAKKKSTAIIEGMDGSTYFVKEGDTLRGVKIIKITPTSVNYLYMKKKNEWKLENR